MKILKIIGIGLVVLIAAVLTLGLIKPTEFKVERSILINSDKGVIMSNVKSLKNMENWSPWAKVDPSMKNTFAGNDGEVGSIHRWEGNENVGVGEQEITAIAENRVETELRFYEPWEAVNQAYFQLDEVDDGIKVTWGLLGENPFPSNAFMNMDAMIGPDYEKGLASLKTLCESTPAITQDIELEEIASDSLSVENIEE